MSSISNDKTITIIGLVVKANLENDDYSKLRHLLETGHPIKEIDLHHFSHL